jgi:hypothetical protein
MNLADVRREGHLGFLFAMIDGRQPIDITTQFIGPLNTFLHDGHNPMNLQQFISLFHCTAGDVHHNL